MILEEKKLKTEEKKRDLIYLYKYLLSVNGIRYC